MKVFSDTSAVYPDPVQEWAQQHAGIYRLYPVQRLVIAGILDSLQLESAELRGQIAVMPTGAGKSLCFQIPAAMDSRPTLVLYPLLALLQDQQRRFAELGIPAAVIRGGQSRQERIRIWRGVRSGNIRVILSNPESMIQPAPLERIREIGFGHLVVDEAHCVCEWGRTFRPTYLQIPSIQRDAGIPVLSAFTATAGPQVQETIHRHLFTDFAPHILLGNPDRPAMGLQVLATLNKDASIQQMFADFLPLSGGSELPLWAPGSTMPRPAIIFCSSRERCRTLALRLNADHPGKIRFYHAGLERSEKDALEKWFFESTDGILIATTAYGMGVDKKNIRSVVHRDVSQSLESYLQEAGRGGRDGAASQAVLLIAPGDLDSPRLQQDPFQQARRQQLIDWVMEPGCRRAALLRRMGAKERPCFGCSRCNPNTPPQAKGYWDRLNRLQEGLAARKRLNAADQRAVVQWIVHEYVLHRFEPPPPWVTKLPWVPEWSEAEAAAALKELGHNRRVQKQFRTLLRAPG